MKEQKLFNFLPDYLYKAVSYLNLNKLYELRIRADKPIKINYGGVYRFLSAYGECDKKESALICNNTDIEKMVFLACERSIYSVTEQMKQGFITTNDGVRIGLGGVYVYDSGSITTIKDINSLTIRVPHEVENCSSTIYDNCLKNRISSLLVLSPPGRGKTTMLRDLCKKISDNYNVNILVSDERNEICARVGSTSVDFGACTDVITYAKKTDAFNSGVRAMRPDIIVTDELTSEEEINTLVRTRQSGVDVIASAHFKSIENMKSSNLFSYAIKQKTFDYYVVLSDKNVGVVECIYGSDLKPIYQVVC